MTAPFTLPIPTYQCHKRVQALRIKAVVPNPRGYELHFEDERFCPHLVCNEWMIANGAGAGGYAVWSTSGYFGFQTAAAFEAGYSLVEDAQRPPQSWRQITQRAIDTCERHERGECKCSVDDFITDCEIDALLYGVTGEVCPATQAAREVGK